jgi:hypothetical protein
MQQARREFRLTPFPARPQRRTRPRTSRPITREEYHSLTNSAREAVRFAEHMIVLCQTIPPVIVQTELMQLRDLGKRAEFVLQRAGGAS